MNDQIEVLVLLEIADLEDKQRLKNIKKGGIYPCRK